MRWLLSLVGLSVAFTPTCWFLEWRGSRRSIIVMGKGFTYTVSSIWTRPPPGADWWEPGDE